MQRPLLLLGSLALCLAGAMRSVSATEIMIPAYFNPSTSTADWATLASAADQGYKITTIINPFNGPLPDGNPQTAAWVNASASVCQECASSLGFVYTRYAQRPIEEVKADILRYRTQGYSLKGIFIDEMPSKWQIDLGEGPLSRNQYLAYYSELYAFIKGLDPTWRVVGNPGINASEVLLTGDGTFGKSADSVIVLEQTASFFADPTPKYIPDAWNQNYSANVGYLIHSAPASVLGDVLSRINTYGGDIVFVTDGIDFSSSGGPDQRYTQLPSYWSTLLASADYCEVPEPGTLALLGLGVAGLAWRRRAAAGGDPRVQGA